MTKHKSMFTVIFTQDLIQRLKMLGNSRPFSYSPRGFPPEEFPQSRWTFQKDDSRRSSPQNSQRSVPRPTAKSIYIQRKEYSETLSRQSDNINVRVEHVLTCELDGQQLTAADDCVTKLKKLNGQGRLWCQLMIMEVQGAYLLLRDTENKAELEALQLINIQQTKAVLDSCAYNSLLLVIVRQRGKRFPQVFIFQCEEMGADLLKSDLDKCIQRGGGLVEPRREQVINRARLDNVIGLQTEVGGPQVRNIPPPPGFHAPRDDGSHGQRDPSGPRRSHELAELTDVERNTEILNHILNDLEVFLGKVLTPPTETTPLVNESKKKKKKNKSAVVSLPPAQECISCIQKIKYGFNLLGQLDGLLVNTSASDYVHYLFNSLATILPHYHADLPSSVLSPLPTEASLRLLKQTVSPEEDRLWRSLGNSWNIPRSRWPDDDVPPYVPEFYDGWRLPPPSPVRLPPPNNSVSRSGSRRFPNDERSEEGGDNMRVMHDFVARNNRELSIMKGEVVEVVQRSKQWWLVRNNVGVEGNVPQYVLEPLRSERRSLPRIPPTLDTASSPPDVRVWLHYKGFSKITVASLGVLNGDMLLQMSKEDMRSVCPEEGAKVFFHLQAVKSAIALASEPSYDIRY
ncbi:epidermal growth factor receptor kinase substrate 8-like protein 3b [Stigmatopora nigra]